MMVLACVRVIVHVMVLSLWYGKLPLVIVHVMVLASVMTLFLVMVLVHVMVLACEWC